MIEPQVTLLHKVNHKTLWGHLDMQGPVTSWASQLDGVAYPPSTAYSSKVIEHLLSQEIRESGPVGNAPSISRWLTPHGAVC
jgi:hypothetical protein